MSKGRQILPLLLTVWLAMSGQAAGKHSRKMGKYPDLEISTFNVKDDIDVPFDFRDRLSKELPHHLADAQKFNRVFEQASDSEDKSTPTLIMKGSFIEFHAGNRAERYLVGLGAGAANVVAHVKFVDRDTGKPIFERDIRAKLNTGVFGGSTTGMADQLVKEIVKIVKRETF